MIYHTKVKSSAVFIHDSSLIPPFPLLFFGGDISMKRDADQETIAVDDWIIFQASQHIAELVKVGFITEDLNWNSDVSYISLSGDEKTTRLCSSAESSPAKNGVI